MKTLKKIITFLFMILCFVSLTSCGFVDSSRNGKAIKSIESIVEDGQTKLVITYEDEEIKPDIFTLPVGKDGVGIQTVIVTDKLDGTGKTISIHMTDGREPEIFELTNGISVTGVSSEIDKETGNTLVYVNYSNGTKSEPIVIQKGEQGLGFTGCLPPVLNDDGTTSIILQFGDKEAEILIPAPLKGNPGRGIENIVSFQEGNKYIMVFKYTDQTEQRIELDKPTDPATWLSGQIPSNNEGKDGDFFFDTASYKIYHKENGQWIVIADLGIVSGTCKVKFELNSPIDSSAKMPLGALTEYTIKKYTYFQDPVNKHGSIPIPTCNGYVFKGWFTKFGNDINETTGKFTDLTPVLSDLVLYAKWEKAV